MDFNELPEKNRSKNQAKNRGTLIFLAIIFIAPVVLAYMAYYGGWFQGKGVSYGEVFKKPWHRDDIAFRGSVIDNWQQSKYKDKWTWLLMVDAATCHEQCQINWLMLQQTHLGMTKHVKHTQWLLVLNHQAEKSDWQQTLPEDWKNIEKITAPMKQGNIFVNKEKIRGFNASPLSVPGIYLMDPLGHLMMRYELVNDKAAAPARSKEIRLDLSRLLKHLELRH